MAKQRKRSDIHRPSMVQPVDYNFVGIWVGEWRYAYDPAATGLVVLEATRIRRHMDSTGGAWSTHEHGGSCFVCGAHAVYLAVFYHAATNTYIRTGMDCAAKMNMGDPERFRRLTDAIAAAQKARAGWKKAEGVLVGRGSKAAWDLFLTVHRPTTQTLEGTLRRAGMEGDLVARAMLADMWADQGLDPRAQPMAWGPDERTLVDIISKLAKWGSLTSAQWNLLDLLVRRIEDRPAQLAREDALKAKRAAEKAQAADAPKGRVNMEVTVLKVEERENDDGSTRTVMTVKHATGWVAWGTVPAVARTVYLDGSQDEVGNTQEDGRRPQRGLGKGDVVYLRATFEPKADDPKFAFFSRPIGCVVRTAEEEAVRLAALAQPAERLGTLGPAPGEVTVAACDVDDETDSDGE